MAIDKHLATMGEWVRPKQACGPSGPVPPEVAAAKPNKRRKPQTALEVSLAGQLKRILGVDLTAMPGLHVLAVLSLLERDRHPDEQVAP